jgi:predicted dehydrogenase
MADKIRVGIVGANAQSQSWGARAHVPALKSLPEYEIKAICTAQEQTAKEAAATFGAEMAFHDYNTMARHPDIDVVAVCVRVPYHREIVMAALEAGKPVYCEWPLGVNLAEAEEMAELARDKGVVNMIGLQGRADPTMNYLRELIETGYVGEVLACTMTFFQPGVLERPLERTWAADRAKGAHTLSIAGGHMIDLLCFCLGEFAEVSSRVATQVRQWRIPSTGEMIDTTAPDNVLVSGVLKNGALTSIHVANVPYNASGWRLEVYGREGTLLSSTNQMAQMTQSRLLGARGRDSLTELPVPERFTLVPEDTPKGVAFNVAQMYARLAQGLREGGKVEPGFDLAVQRHRLLDAIQHASDEGRAIAVR